MNPLDHLEDRLGAWLGQLGLAQSHRPGGVTVLESDDAALLVTAFEQDEATWVRIAAIVLTDVDPSVALLHRVLTLNHDVLLGGFQLFEDRTLAFAATLPGDVCDADTFHRTLRYVAFVASSHAEPLRALAGGRAWSDAPSPRETPC